MVNYYYHGENRVMNQYFISMPASCEHSLQIHRLCSLSRYLNSLRLQYWWFLSVCGNFSCSPVYTTPWTSHQYDRGTHRVQVETGLYIPTCFQVFHVLFFYRAAESCLVYTFLSYPITPSTDNTISMKWNFHSGQASIYFPFLSRSCWDKILYGCLPS